MNKKHYHIYLIENIKTGKTYVGKTSQKYPKRENEHLRCKDHSPIDDAIREEGKENFDVRIYKECDSLEDLDKAEMEIMSILRKEGKELYNVYYGKGQHQIVLTKGKEKYVYPSVAYVSNLTGYTRQTVREACNYNWEMRGFKYAWADEKGHAIENFIKEFIAPIRRKASFKTKVRCVETGKVYNSISDAARAVGVSPSTLGKVFSGLRKTSGGYHWEKVEDE